MESRELLSATYYVDATHGDDSWDGLANTFEEAEPIGHGPWKTIAKVNETAAAGDTILFQRGETWREYVLPVSGTSGNITTYGAYGTGDKPQILGSVELNDTSDWIDTGGNIWSTKPAVDLVTTIGSEMLSNTTFESNGNGWTGFRQFPASSLNFTYGQYTSEHHSGAASYRIKSGSNNGDSSDDIALRTTAVMNIVKDQYYLLDFWARTDSPFTLYSIDLHQSGTPGTNYGTQRTSSNASITTQWTNHKILFKANTTASDAVLSFYMGDRLPGGKSFFIDDVSFRACTPSGSDRLLDCDIGNIIYNNGQSCGTRRWLLSDGAPNASPPYYDINNTGLHSQGDFFYDATDWTVQVASCDVNGDSQNPATHYADIELALGGRLIYANDYSYVTYENLDLRYGGVHGISGSNTAYITVSDCDISYMGGAIWMYDSDGHLSRFGNGIEFYGNAHDNLVQRCKISNIFDSGVSNQCMQSGATQYNITYVNNVISNCNISYEYSMGDSTVHDVKFAFNTCINAGSSWGSAQRSSPIGTHYWFCSGAFVYNLSVFSNLFSGSTHSAIQVTEDSIGMDNVWMDYNLYDSPTGYLADWQGTTYTFQQLSAYQNATAKDAHSKVASPGFVDAPGLDFHLSPNSAAIDAGCGGGVATDYDLIGRPQLNGYDTGAYEFVPPTMVSSITPNRTTVADANVGNAALWLTVVYDKVMNTTVAPTILFPIENPSSTLTFSSGASGWSNSTTYVAKYNVVDANLTLTNIDVRVTGAVDTIGITQSQGDFANKFNIDTQNPTVTINQANGQADPTKTSPINYTVIFSETVSDFATGDARLAGTAGATNAVVTGNGTTYNVAVSGMSGEGSVIASLLASVAHDAAGNASVASTSSDNTVTYDPTPVTVQSIVINDGNAQRSKVTSVVVTFSEIVAIDAGAFEVLKKGTGGGSVTAAVAAQVLNGKTVATLTFSGGFTEYSSLKDGEYQLTVRSDNVRDSDTLTALDGDADGQFGGNRVFGSLLTDNFFRKFGDSDGDRDVDSLDLARFRLSYLSPSNYKWYFDFEGDGDVDSLDLARFRLRYLT